MQQRRSQGLEWMHRDYLAYVQKGFHPDAALRTRAIDWTLREAGWAPTAENRVKVGMHVDSLLGSYDTGDIPQRRWSQATVNGQVITRRDQIPSIYRQLMGEVHNPAYVVAQSAAHVEQLYGQYQVSKAFTDAAHQGVVWDNQPRLHLHPAAI